MGIHSGGMIVTRDPLMNVAPIEWASMRDRTIVQWDKDDLSDLGLIKIDLLGLGMLSLLRDAFALHARCYPERPPLSLESIPIDDKPTYEMLQRADSIGVFQVESRAQQSMLPRLKPACFYDIVMQVAIIRPGPIQGDMVHPFLRRRNGLEPVTYPHPSLKPILERTLGVPLFQEQGMRMAMETAGFSGGEADELRRAMGHKRSRDRMAQIYPRLVNGMVANGIEREVADRLFHMLEGFADYGFPESHAASFALLAYASAYVKCHEPAIFCAAILNVQPMGFYSTEVLVNDARRHGVVVRPIDGERQRMVELRRHERRVAARAFISCAGWAKRSARTSSARSPAANRSPICSTSRGARNWPASRSKTSPPAVRSRRGTRPGATRSGRCARSTNAKRAASWVARWRSTTSRHRSCSNSPRSNAPRSTSPRPASPTYSRSRTSAPNSTRAACSPPNGCRRCPTTWCARSAVW